MRCERISAVVGSAGHVSRISPKREAQEKGRATWKAEDVKPG